METEISRLVTQLARIRNVEVSYVYETLKQSIIAGLKRRFGREVRHEVEVNPMTGEISIVIIQTAAAQVRDISQEIALDEACRIRPDVKEGEDVRIEIPLQEVGRVAIQRTVDELTHRLREAERTKLYNEFIKKKGEIISGTIHKIEKEEVLVNLGPIYGILPLRDQLKTDHLQIGTPFKFYVLRVERTPIGPRVFLSRTHPEFLRRLLAREVPEIQQSIVEIKGVARIPGVRSKVAVTSHDEKIDPIGACVGYRKVRIQNVTKELSGEKIDVIQWSSEHKVFIERAMSPARVSEVVEERDAFTVIVPDEEFSKAIGRKGQNVWLASLLTAAKLDILKDSDYRNRLFSQRMAQIMIETLDFLGDETRKTLVEAGFTTVVSLYEQPATEVSKVLGWDPTRIEQIKTQIREELERRELERKLFERKKLEKMKSSAEETETLGGQATDEEEAAERGASKAKRSDKKAEEPETTVEKSQVDESVSSSLVSELQTGEPESSARQTTQQAGEEEFEEAEESVSASKPQAEEAENRSFEDDAQETKSEVELGEKRVTESGSGTQSEAQDEEPQEEQEEEVK